jgi:hypothetical protein
MVEALFSWTVIGILVVGLSGAGLSVLSMTPPRPRIAEVCFAISALLLWAKFSFWAVTSNATWKERVLVSFLVFGISGTLLIVVLNWVEGIIPRKIESAVADTSTVMVRPDVMQLPITLPPSSTAYLIELHPERKQWITELPNPGSVPLLWPSSAPKGQQSPIMVYRWMVSNHGEKELLSISLSFPIHFHGLSTKRLKVTKLSGQRMQAHVYWEGDDPYIRLGMVIGKGKKAFHVYPGEVVSQHVHEVVIPSIAPHQSANVYFLNASRLFALFDFPEKATALITGNSEKSVVDLIRPEVTVLDSAKKMGLQPSGINAEEFIKEHK